MEKEKFDYKQLSMFVVAGIFGGLITLGGIKMFSSDSFGPTTKQTLQVQEESETVGTVKKVLPSVVAITTKQQMSSFFGGTYTAQGGGSGFVVDPNGLIVTNKHVASSDTATYSVITNDGKSYDAKVVARDPLADLAVLKISAKNLPVVELGDSDKLELGQKVIAIGNALGEYQNSVTTGVVSGIGRTITAGDSSGSSGETLSNVIQTDAAINPGNSGGPLINLDGQVIGINTAIDQQGSAIGFALPINSVKQAIASAVATGTIVRPKLGVRYTTITKEFAAANNMDITQGALVQRGSGTNDVAVEPGSPADVAGLKEGDILVSVNSDNITEQADLIALLQKYKPGDTVQIKYIRQGVTKTIDVKLGKAS